MKTTKVPKKPMGWPRLAALPMVAALALSAVGLSVQPTSAAYSSKVTTPVTAKAKEWIVPTFEAFSKDYRSGTVSWEKAGAYGTYRLQWSTSSSFANPVSATVTGTSHTVTGLSGSTTYYFRVQAVDAPTAPSKGWSEAANMKTPAQAATTSSLLFKSKDPHGASLDSTGILWTTDYKDGAVRRTTTAGATSVVGTTVADGNPRGISLINNSLAVFARSYNKDPDNPLAGLYTMTSAGVAKKVANFKHPYGVVYNPVNKKVYVSHNAGLSECNSSTWACTTALPAGTGSIYHIDVTPDGKRITMAGANSNVLSVYDVATKKRTVLVGTKNLDVRGVYAIGNNDFLASSWTSGTVWRIKLNEATGIASSDAIVTGAEQPRSMVYDAARNVVYLAESRSPNTESRWSKYVNLVR